jgi:hypothetical protein
MSNDSQGNHRPCRHLRSKEMFYDTGTPSGESHGSGIFWCTHTANCLGPDGTPASDEDCGPDRNCYQQ